MEEVIVALIGIVGLATHLDILNRVSQTLTHPLQEIAVLVDRLVTLDLVAVVQVHRHHQEAAHQDHQDLVKNEKHFSNCIPQHSIFRAISV